MMPGVDACQNIDPDGGIVRALRTFFRSIVIAAACLMVAGYTQAQIKSAAYPDKVTQIQEREN